MPHLTRDVRLLRKEGKKGKNKAKKKKKQQQQQKNNNNNNKKQQQQRQNQAKQNNKWMGFKQVTRSLPFCILFIFIFVTYAIIFLA